MKPSNKKHLSRAITLLAESANMVREVRDEEEAAEAKLNAALVELHGVMAALAETREMTMATQTTELPDSRGKRRCACGRRKTPELWSCWDCYDKERERRAQADPVLKEHLGLMKKAIVREG